MMTQGFLGKKFTIVVFVLAVSCAGHAQLSTGTILGRVTDPSGAVIPRATIVVTNSATGVAVNGQTNSVGDYVFPFLRPGTYQLKVQANGFKTTLRDNLQLQVDERMELNLSLEVGITTESVNVISSAPLLQTASASSGLDVDTRRVTDLPTTQGVAFSLIELAPGTNFGSITNLAQEQPFAGNFMDYAMDGTEPGSSVMTMDGTAPRVNNSIDPPADAIAEFKVLTTPFDASIGDTAGGSVDVVTKSGTNTLHGTAYDDYMTPALTANTFFGNYDGQPRANYTYNRYGGSIGGPVVLPKLYNGHNRTFFFAASEAMQEHEPDGTTTTVPTAAERVGDFSALLALGSNYQIYNPFTRMAIGGGLYQEAPVPDNCLGPAATAYSSTDCPSNAGLAISPIAQSILSYYSLPNTAGTSDFTNNYSIPNAPEIDHYNTFLARVDHSFGERQHLFIRFNDTNRHSIYDNWFNNAATGDWYRSLDRGGDLDYAYVFSPSFTMDFRYGLDRWITGDDNNPASYNFDLTSLGFPASYNSEIPASVRRFPYINISGYETTRNSLDYIPLTIQDFQLSFNKIIGSHDLRFGIQFRINRASKWVPNNTSTGEFDASTTWTQGPLSDSPASPIGQGLASFLLGLPTGGQVTVEATRDAQDTEWGAYLQDDWTVTSKLSLNIGMRYEYQTPLRELNDNADRGFDPAAQLPIATQAEANYSLNPTPEVSPSQFIVQGGMTFPGVGGEPSTLWVAPKLDFSPRVGLAYRIGSNTVLRGGYGIFDGFLGDFAREPEQNGFSQSTTLIPSTNNGLTFVGTLTNPFPNGIEQPTGASLGAMTYAGLSIQTYNTNPLMPYQQRWQFGVQRIFPGSVRLDVNYVGNRGVHELINRNLDAFPDQYLSTLPARDTATINYWAAQLPNPFYPSGGTDLLPGTSLDTTTLPRSQLVLAYPQFTGVTVDNNQGYSTYNALQVQAERRFANGFTLMGNYTWSHFIEAVSYLNPGDPKPEYVVSTYDFPQHVGISGIYELPFGNGRMWLAQKSAVTEALIGGWQVQGFYMYQDGPALGFGDALFTGNVDDIPLPRSKRNIHEWFNVNAGFNTKSSQQLATNLITFPARLSNVRADGINQMNFSVIKNIPVHESLKLQFHAEAFNALNHPMFGAPNTTPTSSAFGTVTTTNGNPRRVELALKLIF